MSLAFTTLLEGRGLLEGPRGLADGSVLVADVTQGGVLRVGTDGTVAEEVPRRRGVGGLVPHRDGGVVVSGRELVHVRGGATRMLLAPAGVAGFNDLHTDAEGAVLAGALRFRPVRGEEPVPGEVWRLDPGGTAAVVLEGVLWANGIGLSPAADRLYVSDFAAGHVLVADPRGPARRGEVFARAPEGSCDGLAVDDEGGVWVALGPAGGVARFRPDGSLDRVEDVPAAFASSVAFAGRDLLVTTVGALLRAPAPVAGPAATPAAV